MKWRDQKKAAKKLFPYLTPTRAGDFTGTDDGTCVIIPLHDASASLVLGNYTDLMRAKGMIELVLKAYDTPTKRR